MAYVSLYRKYRPQTFEEVVGQQHVTRTLIHALEEDRLHHAHLFTGPRGTGKTSTARILAKALNCEQGPTPTPCGVCQQCREIAAGSSVDVIELDMASHGGVDDARELRERALFAPASARRKVYILDEVHMASTAAFNALLKLIEEPPGHVLFAMATTDPQKVLPTIMSRVQRFDLRRVAATEVAAHVRRICDLEGFAIEDGAVDAIVRAGDGSVRDTLSVLEQVLSYAGRDVTTDDVGQVLGATPADRTFACVDLMAAQDLAGLMTLVQDLLDGGHDLRRFTLDLLQHLRDLLVLQVAPDQPDLVDATAERRQELAGQALTLPREALVRAVDVLAGTLTEQRQGPPRLPLELALAKLALPAVAGDVGALAERVARLEAAPSAPPASGGESPPGSRVGAPPASGAESSPASRGDAPPAAAPAEQASDAASDEPAATATPPAGEPGVGHAPAGVEASDVLVSITSNWEAILDLVKRRSRRIHAVFEPSRPAAWRNGILTLRYPRRYASFHAANAKKGEFAEALQQAVQRVTGARVRIDTLVEGEQRRPQPPVVSSDDGPVAAPPSDEEAAVREAEQEQAELEDPARAAARAEELLRDELGAERVDGA